MGLHTGLYDYTEKEFIDLGKSDGNEFQIDSEKIIKFLAGRIGHDIRTITDDKDLPIYNEEEKWIEVDCWYLD